MEGDMFERGMKGGRGYDREEGVVEGGGGKGEC